MSATQRSQSSYLTDLLAAPQSYELLQALRLVQHEVGMGHAPIEVRYRASLSLAYPQAEIESMALIAQDNMEDSGRSVKDGQIKDNSLNVSSLMARQIEVCPAVIGLTDHYQLCQRCIPIIWHRESIMQKTKQPPLF